MGLLRRKIIASSVYRDERLKTLVHITVRANARSFIARWRCEQLYITVPPSTTLERYNEVFEQMLPGILAGRDKKRNGINPGPGTDITLHDYTIHIISSGRADNYLDATLGTDEATISLGTLIDPTTPSGLASVSKMVGRILGKVAPRLLLPRAREIASKLGVSPRSINISRGHRQLGKCNSHGDIYISSVVMMLPPHLRDYIVCHELAHLSEMNHSPRFHALCDSYCGGHEKALIAELNAFSWPISM